MHDSDCLRCSEDLFLYGRTAYNSTTNEHYPVQQMVEKVNRPVANAFLTADELECVDHLAKAANLGFKIIREGGEASMWLTGKKCDEHDVNEWALHIHQCQQTIMSQAAGRAVPETFRLLGGAHHGS